MNQRAQLQRHCRPMSMYGNVCSVNGA